MERMLLFVDIGLRVLNGNRPLVIKPWRKEDATICQEKPIRIGEMHINIPPGTIVTRALITEHGTPLRANLGHMHGHVIFLNDAHIALSQLLREADCMGVSLWRENLG